MEWMCKNYKDWKKVAIEDIKKELEGCIPCVVDRSKTVESENTNIETREIPTLKQEKCSVVIYQMVKLMNKEVFLESMRNSRYMLKKCKKKV